ncbi:MAG: MATE family efflux transporter [Firmicutes bacterium]|nr:MATE family efflux transporter [Bacillota bacterium]
MSKANQLQQYQKMTTLPIPRLVISLGIPTVISMLVTNIYNLADTYFVGRLGTSASGAVGVIFGLMSIIQAVGFMLGQGAGSILARRLGQKDEESAGIYASVSFFLALIMGVVFTVTALILIDPLLDLLGCTTTILPYAKKYATYILLATPAMMCCFVLNNVLRFEGKARLAMIGLVSGGILNMVGDPIFMFIFNMGIDGAGLSTALSQYISFMILLSIFLLKKTQSVISLKNFLKITPSKTWEIFTIGLPSLVRQGLSSISIMLLNQCARNYGDSAVAAMSIVSRISFFFFAIGLGLGQGFQPVCSFNYGAKLYSRVKEAFKFTLKISGIVIGIFALCGIFFAPFLISLFRNDPLVIQKGHLALILHCIALTTHPISVMANMTFQSTGNKLPALISSMMRSGLYFIPVLLILHGLFGFVGVQCAQPLADLLSALTVMPMITKFFAKLPADGK